MRKLLTILMILICTASFAQIDMTLGGGTAGGNSWTASGSTQIYTEKSVGIGTSTPDVDYKCFVDGKIAIPSQSYTDVGLNLDSGKTNTGFTFDGTWVRLLVGNVGCFYAKGNEFYANSSLYGKYISTTNSGVDPNYPSFTKSGDSNTGIYFPAADNLAITTGGTEVMRLTDKQNVLIGTTTDDGVNKLQVVGDSDLDGNVSIGEGDKLYLNKGQDTYLRGLNGLYLYKNGYPCLELQSYKNTSHYSMMFPQGSLVQVAVGDRYNNDTGLYFPATDNVGFVNGGVETFRTTENNNVLIGTTTDDGVNKLQVVGDSEFDGDMEIISTSGTIKTCSFTLADATTTTLGTVLGDNNLNFGFVKIIGIGYAGTEGEVFVAGGSDSVSSVYSGAYFATSDTAGKLCVYSSGSAVYTIKNNTGSSRTVFLIFMGNN